MWEFLKKIDWTKILSRFTGSILMIIAIGLLTYGIIVLATNPTIEIYHNEIIDGEIEELYATITNPVWPAVGYASLIAFTFSIIAFIIDNVRAIWIKKEQNKHEQKMKELEVK